MPRHAKRGVTKEELERRIEDAGGTGEWSTNYGQEGGCRRSGIEG